MSVSNSNGKPLGERYVCVCVCSDSEEKAVSGNSELCMHPSTQKLAVKNGALLKRVPISPCAARSSETHHTPMCLCVCACVCCPFQHRRTKKNRHAHDTGWVPYPSAAMIYPPTFHAVPPVSLSLAPNLLPLVQMEQILLERKGQLVNVKS